MNRRILALAACLLGPLALFSGRGAEQTAPPQPLTIDASEEITNSFSGIPALHSYVSAVWQGKWILLGGRASGYHAMGGKISEFSRTEANPDIWVIDPDPNAKQKVAHLPVSILPPRLRQVADQWLATSLLEYQDGDTLYISGGYGENVDHHWVTYPLISAVNLPALAESVLSGQDHFSKTVAYAETPLVQCTGGRLIKLNDGSFYLVMGHVFMGRYGEYEANGEQNRPAVSQKYLGEIRKLKIERAGDSLRVTQLAVYADPEFARRDLNVTYRILSDGSSLGGAVYGGVFTKDQLSFAKPIYFSDEEAPQVDSAFEQKMNGYNCATILLYDRQSRTMYTTFLGGITRWLWNSKTGMPELAPKMGDKASDVYLDGMEWTNQISTLQQRNGKTSEFAQTGARLPGYLGTSAVFFPASGLTSVVPGKEILDLAQFRGHRVFAGYLYGGIEAFPKQFPYTAEAKTVRPGATPTKPSNRLIKVYVSAP